MRNNMACLKQKICFLNNIVTNILMIEGSNTWSTMIINILTQNIYQDRPNAFKDRNKSHTHTQRNATSQSTKKQVQSRNDQNSSLI